MWRIPVSVINDSKDRQILERKLQCAAELSDQLKNAVEKLSDLPSELISDVSAISLALKHIFNDGAVERVLEGSKEDNIKALKLRVEVLEVLYNSQICAAADYWRNRCTKLEEAVRNKDTKSLQYITEMRFWKWD